MENLRTSCTNEKVSGVLYYRYVVHLYIEFLGVIYLIRCVTTISLTIVQTTSVS